LEMTVLQAATDEENGMLSHAFPRRTAPAANATQLLI
jgi:hypothetical protein